jgi:ADP-heptose:LPS heptosyltransferase
VVFEWFLNVVLMGFAMIVRAFRGLDASRPGVVCIFRCDAIGDFILFSASLQGYRLRFKSEKLILIVRDIVYPLARGCPYVDEVWSVPSSSFRRSFATRWNWMMRMARAEASVAINAVYGIDLAPFECLVGWTAAPKRIGHGYVSNKGSRRRVWPFYTHLVAANSTWKHELLRNSDVLVYLGLQEYRSLGTELWLNDADKASGSLLLSELADSSFVVISPGSREKYKQWPVESYIRLVGELLLQTDLSVVLCGSEDEKPLCEAIAEGGTGVGSRLLILAGKTSLRELAYVISQSTLCIGNDSAAVHMAAALRVQSIVLVGGGDFGMFFPYPQENSIRVVANKLPCFQCRWFCKFDEMLCITHIEVNSVLQNVIDALPVRRKEPQADSSTHHPRDFGDDHNP